MSGADTVNVAALIAVVEARAPGGGPLDRLAVAVEFAADLQDVADTLVGHFVDEARQVGASWRDIGDRLGVSKQGAQQRFVPREPATATDLLSGAVSAHWTERAKRAIQHADNDARRRRHLHVGTEHLLLGIVHDKKGLAAAVLDELSVGLADVKAGIEAAAAPGADTVPDEPLPFTPLSRRVIDLCAREALRLGHNYVGTEHILLALIRVEDGLACEVLHRLGAGYDDTRAAIVRALSAYAAG